MRDLVRKREKGKGGGTKHVGMRPRESVHHIKVQKLKKGSRDQKHFWNKQLWPLRSDPPLLAVASRHLLPFLRLRRTCRIVHR